MKTARVRKIREDVTAESPPAPAPEAPPANEEPHVIIEGIRVSKKATEWRIDRQRENGKGERLYYGVKPNGSPRHQWPLGELSSAAIGDRWGGGNYRVRFVGYDDSGKQFLAGTHPWVVVGEPKVPLVDDDDDDGAKPVIAGDAVAIMMRGMELQGRMARRSAALAREEIRGEVDRMRIEHEQRMAREKADSDRQLERERQRHELDMKEREQRWAREKDEAERKAREAREAPEKVAKVLNEGVEQAVAPLKETIEELRNELDELRSGASEAHLDEDELGAVKKVGAYFDLAARVFGPIVKSPAVQDFVARVVQGAVQAAQEATAAGAAGGAPPQGGGGDAGAG